MAVAGAAHSVEGDGRDGDRKIGEHHREPPDVRPLLAGLGDGAVQDVFYQLRADPGPSDKAP